MDKWISVTDNLPKDDSMILIYDLHHGISLGFLSMIDDKFRYFDEDGYPREYLYVTHWMPIPEPPEKEN